MRSFGYSQQSPIQGLRDSLDSIRRSASASSFPQISRVPQCQRQATRTAIAAFSAAWLYGRSLSAKKSLMKRKMARRRMPSGHRFSSRRQQMRCYYFFFITLSKRHAADFFNVSSNDAAYSSELHQGAAILARRASYSATWFMTSPAFPH